MAITQNELHALFDYNSMTGIFIRKQSINNTQVGIVGIVGSLISNGYLTVSIKNKTYYLHRLVWLYVYGGIPKDEIDHINHCRTDNRLCNLREVTRLEQTQNASLRNDNTSGCVGVSWINENNRWRVRISVEGKNMSLGCYINFHEAVDARKNAEILYGFHENHGGN